MAKAELLADEMEKVSEVVEHSEDAPSHSLPPAQPMDIFEDEDDYENNYEDDEEEPAGKATRKRSELSVKGVLIGLLLVIVGFGFVLCFSRSTSPLCAQAPAGDSALSQVIGRSWAEGVLPYEGIYADGGPLVYLTNAVGYSLFQDRFGIILLQVLAIWLTEYYLYRIFRLRFPQEGAMLLTICGLAALGMCYGVGNTAEEWLLPFLTASCYYMLYWTEAADGENTHNLWAGCLYGFTIGLCAISLPAYALPVVLMCLLLLVQLLLKGELLNLVRLIFCFLFGAAAAVLPLGYYFYTKKLLPGLQAGYMDYMKGLLTRFGHVYSAEVYLDLALNYCWVLALMAATLVALCCKVKSRNWLWLLLMLPVGGLLATGSVVERYAIATLPLLAVAAVLVAQPRMPKAVGAVLAALIMLAAAGWGGYQGCMEVLLPGLASQQENKAVPELLEMIPADNRDSLVLYNVEPQLYLTQNITPATYFFAEQEALADQKDIAGDLTANSPLWVITGEETAAVEQVLAENYTMITGTADGEQRCYLYRRNV